MKYIDLFNKALEQEEKLKLANITHSTNEIVNGLKERCKFDEQKSFMFVIYLLGILASLNDGLTQELYDDFQKSTGISVAYDDLVAFYDKEITKNFEDSIIEAIHSYDEELSSSVLVYCLSILSLKGSYSENDLDFLSRLVDSPIDIEIKTAEEVGTSSSSLVMQERVMSLPREKRVDLAIYSANKVKEKMNDKDLANEIILYFTLWFAELNYGDDKKSEYSIASKYLDITYENFMSHMQEDLNEDNNKKYLSLAKENKVEQEIAFMGLGLTCAYGIMGMDVLKVVGELLK